MKELIILCTSDLHGFTEGARGKKGFAPTLKSLKKKYPEALIVDNGDYLVGAAPTTFFNTEKEISPLIELANEIPYDVMVPGNHDFDYGPAFLKRQARHFSGHYLCCNVYTSEGKLLFQPYGIFQREGWKVGIIGAVTSALSQLTDPRNLKGILAADVIGSLKYWTNILRPQVDVLVVSYHGGSEKDLVTGHPTQHDTGEDQAWRILTEVSGIDGLILGHQHRDSAGVSQGVAFVQPDFAATSIGMLRFFKEGDILQKEACLLTGEDKSSPGQMASGEPNPLWQKEYERWLQEPVDDGPWEDYLRRRIGVRYQLGQVDFSTRKQFLQSFSIPYALSTYSFSKEELQDVTRNRRLLHLQGREKEQLSPADLQAAKETQPVSDEEFYEVVSHDKTLPAWRLKTNYIYNAFDEYHRFLLKEQTLRIIYTSDVHSFFLPTDYTDRRIKDMGLLACAGAFQNDENTLIIDGGDSLQGSPLASYCREKFDSPFLQAALMNSVGYHMVTLGNHDFNYGMDYLKQYLALLEASCVCENVRLAGEEKSLYPYEIRRMKNGLKVAFIGLVTDYVKVWEKRENLQGIDITDAFEAARQAVEKVKDQVDLIVGIYHGGFEAELETGEILTKTRENIGYRLCKELDFHILLTGHQHRKIPGQYVHGTYVVQPPANAGAWIQVDVRCRKNRRFDTGAGQTTSSNAWSQMEITSVLHSPKAEDMKRVPFILEEVEAKVQTWLDQRAGLLNKEALTGEKLSMAMEGPLAVQLIGQVQLEASKAQLTSVALANNAPGFRREVTLRDIIATYPYSNQLVTVEITGKQLREVLEKNAEYFSFDDKGEICISSKYLHPKVEHYQYDYFFGIHYEINVSQENGHHIENLQYQGKEVEDQDTFTMALSSYRAGGGGDFFTYQHCPVLEEGADEVLELLIRYIQSRDVTVIEETLDYVVKNGK